MKKKIIITSLFIVILLSITVPIYALSPSSNQIYKGIDVSEWQGNIDFAKVKKQEKKLYILEQDRALAIKMQNLREIMNKLKKMD